jgi:tRNA-dihydrouridine synthase
MLLLLIDRHLRRTGVPPTSFGRRAIGDPNLVRQLRTGRQLRPGTAARLLAYIQEDVEP